MLLKSAPKRGTGERSWNFGDFNLNSLEWNKDYLKLLGQHNWEGLGWILGKIPHAGGGQGTEKLPRERAGP